MRRSFVDLGLAFVVLIWGISPTFFTIVLGTLQPLAFVLVRFVLLSLISIAVLAVYLRRSGRNIRIARRDIPWLIMSGLCGYGIYQLFYMIGLAHTTTFSSSLFVATLPLFSAIILALARIERIHPIQWAGIALSFGGIVGFLYLAGTSGGNGAEIGQHVLTAQDVLLGDLLTIGSVILFALYGIANKRLATSFAPPELMCYTLIIGTLALIPTSLPQFLSQDWSLVGWQTWLIIVYAALFPVYITYTIWNWAIGKRGVAYVTLYSYPVPVLAGIFAWIIIKQALTVGQIVAASVVLLGMGLARWGITRLASNERAATTSIDSQLDAATAPAETLALPLGE
jgi:drug/metabolite transporter (DMT)-like permease